MPDEILTLRDVAALRKLAGRAVCSMVHQGKSPASKVRGQWRNRRADLDRRVDGQPRKQRAR